MPGSGLLRLLFFLLLSQGIGAQTLLPLPSDSVHAIVSLGQANEVLLEFANPGPDSLHLRWKLLESELPAGWDVDLCDHGNCYTGIPSTAMMVPAPPGVNPYLKLIVQPGALHGQGKLSFRVYLVQDISQAVTVHFRLTTSATSITQQPFAGSLRAYPNPVGELLFLEYSGTEPAPSLEVIGPDGRKVAAPFQVQFGLNAVDVTSWPQGVNHIISLSGSKLTILRQ